MTEQEFNSKTLTFFISTYRVGSEITEIQALSEHIEYSSWIALSEFEKDEFLNEIFREWRNDNSDGGVTLDD